jgi:hypothetical protein
MGGGCGSCLLLLLDGFLLRALQLHVLHVPTLSTSDRIRIHEALWMIGLTCGLLGCMEENMLTTCSETMLLLWCC